jgi:hypothetical protein
MATAVRLEWLAALWFGFICAVATTACIGGAFLVHWWYAFPAAVWAALTFFFLNYAEEIHSDE